MALNSATALALTSTIVITFVATTQTEEFWKNTVVYQVYVRSFKDSDGDGIGDIDGIIEKLPYLHMLGVGAICLSPIYRSPMMDQGYDVSDFRAVDDLYGGNEAFDRLIKMAKEHGLKVLLDFVPNHSSNQHEWFRASENKVTPFIHFYVWRNGRSKPNGSEPDPPNNWLSRYGGSAWEWSPKRKQFYLHTYSAYQPDLNFRIRQVQLAIKDAMRYWLIKGVSGFRMIGVANLYESDDFVDEPVASRQDYSPSNYDSLAHLFTTNLNETLDMVHRWQYFVEQYAQDTASSSRLLIVDVNSDLDHVLSYYGDSSDPGAHPANPLFVKFLNRWSSALDIGTSILKWHSHMKEGRWANWMLGTPDVSRVASRFGKARVDLLHMISLLLPGMALTYYGEELGMLDTVLESGLSKDPWMMTGGSNRTRDPARAPFQWDSSTSAGFSTNKKPWLPVHSSFHFDNLHSQQRDSRSHYSIYWRLVAMRGEPSIAKGSFSLTIHDDDVLSFLRNYKNHDAFVVIINFGKFAKNVDVTLNYTLPKSVRVCTPSKNFNLDVGERVDPKNVELSPYSGVVLTTGKVKDYIILYSSAGPSLQLSSALGVTLPLLYSICNWLIMRRL